MFGSEKALVRFDMSEFMEKHSVSKLIGSPPGYVGYEEGGQLTERVKRAPYSVVLLDEIEKAHPDVFNILLQVFEDGQLTDGLGNTVDFMFGSDKSLVRFDMSEFMEKHSVSKLIGSPPGYVGYEEGGQLTERVKRAPYSVVLLDEIEKAHPDVFNILLQVFEDGQLTDGLGNTVDFKNAIIIMTSNIGARHLMKREGLGFQSSKEDMVSEKVEDLVKSEVKRTFNPEFLNRVDEIILFSALNEGDLIQILELMVIQLNQNLAQKSITVTVTDEAKKWVLSQTLSDRSYGARPLRRALQKYIEDPLSEALIQGTIATRPAFIEVFLEDNKLYYRSVDSQETEGVLLCEN